VRVSIRAAVEATLGEARHSYSSTPATCAAAGGAYGSASRDNRRAGVAWLTVQRAEAAEVAVPTTRGRVLASIVGALEAAGVEFLAPSRASPGCGEGVRMRR
jgi:hypothetical protein